MTKIFSMPLAKVYPLYVAKLEKKDRSEAELLAVMQWLTGFDEHEIRHHVEVGSTFPNFLTQPCSTRSQKILRV